MSLRDVFNQMFLVRVPKEGSWVLAKFKTWTGSISHWQTLYGQQDILSFVLKLPVAWASLLPAEAWDGNWPGYLTSCCCIEFGLSFNLTCQLSLVDWFGFSVIVCWSPDVHIQSA